MFISRILFFPWKYLHIKYAVLLEILAKSIWPPPPINSILLLLNVYVQNTMIHCVFVFIIIFNVQLTILPNFNGRKDNQHLFKNDFRHSLHVYLELSFFMKLRKIIHYCMIYHHGQENNRINHANVRKCVLNSFG